MRDEMRDVRKKKKRDRHRADPRTFKSVIYKGNIGHRDETKTPAKAAMWRWPVTRKHKAQEENDSFTYSDITLLHAGSLTH